MKLIIKNVVTPGVLILAAGIFSNVSAAPLVSLGDNADLFLTGAVTGQYNSNILSAPGGTSKKDDYIITLTPGIELQYGHDGPTMADLSYNEQFLRYAHNSSLDTQLATVTGIFSENLEKLSASEKASYTQAYTNTPTTLVTGAVVTSIVRDNVVDSNTGVQYNLSEKFEAGLDFDYTNTQYVGSTAPNYQNTDNYVVSANTYYVYSPEISVGVNYAFTESDPQSSAGAGFGRDRENNYGGVSAKFSQWQKLTGTVGVGVTSNHIDADPTTGASSVDTTTIGYNAALAYAYSAKFTATLAGNRSFSTGAQGQNVEGTSIGLTGHYAYSDVISADANFLTFSYSQYLQTPVALTNGTLGIRDDDNYTTGITLNWQASQYVKLSVAYSYLMNSSNAVGATYNINIVSISANVKY